MQGLLDSQVSSLESGQNFAGGVDGGRREGHLEGHSDAQLLQSIRDYRKCLDLRGIGLPNSGLRVCSEQCPKLLKLTCRVCEFPHQGLSPECPKPLEKWLRDFFGGLCWSGALEVGNSNFVFQSRPCWRGNPEVGSLVSAPKTHECPKPLNGGWGVFVGQASGKLEPQVLCFSVSLDINSWAIKIAPNLRGCTKGTQNIGLLISLSFSAPVPSTKLLFL
ncbi:hypothetical protein PIB30_016954 [Stylosanthes scabra]|uniref:Uncharacterized protein n=1 Tax=Stylosanthes scabra TaxID=79078 RepID=A0ABU6Y9B8_9FABA|nr:hypothetical protein [Stylosanthes scabra]